jgi:hypothetical protein
MGIDFSRVANSALQAALEGGEQPQPKEHHRRLTAGKAIVGGAALALAAKYAVDKTSGVKGKAAMAALRHTARTTFGDVIPESLHDKLMDAGFFDHDGEGIEVKDFFGKSDEGEPEEQDFVDETDEDYEAEPEEQDFFDEPEDEADEDEDADEPEDDDVDEPVDEEPVDEEDLGEPEDDVDEDDEPDVNEDDEPDDDEDDEPEDEPVDEPDGDAEAEPEDADEDEQPRDEDRPRRATRAAAPANGRGEAPGVMDVLSDAPRRRRRTRRRASASTPAERPPAPPKKRSTKAGRR